MSALAMDGEYVVKRLFDEVVARCGLAAFLAQDVVRRACDAAGLAPDTLTRAQLPVLVPSLRKSLALFMKHRQLDGAMRAIAALAEPASDDRNGKTEGA